MNTAPDQIPFDDTEKSEADDQQSQKDIHSNGLVENGESSPEDEVAHDADQLQQASVAAEASFTLNTDDGLAPDPNTANKGKPNHYNLKQ